MNDRVFAEWVEKVTGHTLTELPVRFHGYLHTAFGTGVDVSTAREEHARQRRRSTRDGETVMRNHTEGLALRLMGEITQDIEKAHYLNAAHKAAELQLTLLRLLSDVLKNPGQRP